MPFDEFRGGGTTWDDWDPSQLFQGKSFAFVLLYFWDPFYIDINKAIPLDSDQIFVFFVGNTLSLPNLQSFRCPMMIVCTTWTQCLLRLLWENWHDFCRNVITKWMMVVSFVAQSWLWILMSSSLALLLKKLYYRLVHQKRDNPQSWPF